MNMSSIVVVHTNRFYTEFMDLYSLLFEQSSNASEPLPTKAVKNLTETTIMPKSQKVKILMDIQAGAPVILLPYSASSEQMLVVDLGHLSVKNTFNENAGVVLNNINIDLIEMDLYCGMLISTSSKQSSDNRQWNLHTGFVVVKSENSSSFLKQQCQMNLKVQRKFSSNSGDSSAATTILGALSAIYCTLDSQKYCVSN